MKIVFHWLMALFIGLAVPLGLAEVAIRAYHYVKYDKGVSQITLDGHLGWKPSPNFGHEADKVDAAGNKYHARVTTNAEGFRAFGDPARQDRKRVLFVGDSFTHAIEVSDDKTFYALLERSLPVSAFAYAAVGYGTLQELMVLERYMDTVKPELVVLQFHPNDFINNSLELELASNMHNNGMRRPYLGTGEAIEYRTPSRLPWFRDFGNEVSRLMHIVAKSADRLMIDPAKSVEASIKREGTGNRAFMDSVATTDRLVARMARLTRGRAQLLAFSADNTSPYNEQIAAIMARHGIPFLEEVPKALREAESGGACVKAADNAHWNETGHRIVAETIGKSLRDRNVFAATPSTGAPVNEGGS